MDFSERFSQVLQQTWGYNTDGNLDREGSLVFYLGGSVSEETSVCFEGGIYSFYVYERGERGNPLIQSSRLNVMEHCLTLKYANSFRIKRGFPPLQLYRTIRMHVEWSLVPVDLKPWHGFLAFEGILVFSSRVGRRMMIFLLLFLMLLSILLWMCWSVICDLMVVRS